MRERRGGWVGPSRIAGRMVHRDDPSRRDADYLPELSHRAVLVDVILTDRHGAVKTGHDVSACAASFQVVRYGHGTLLHEDNCRKRS